VARIRGRFDARLRGPFRGWSCRWGPVRCADVSTPSVRLATRDDAGAIMAIYNVEVEHHVSTFDLVPRTLAEQQDWVSQRSGAFSAVVAELDGPDGPEVVGFASLSPYKERAAYRTTVEDSVYVSRLHPRLGIGRALMEHVIGIARDSGFHAVMARIEASGAASRQLHASCGFELVGVERQVGRKFNRWLDVAIMQLLL
jgi:L-amino acid N-acyltransferase YncA